MSRFLPLLTLTACATFGQAPKPIGEPGPIACVSAQSAEVAWGEVDKYLRGVLAAQTSYSCGPVAPPSELLAVPVPPVVPAFR